MERKTEGAVVGKSASIHSTQARFIQRNGIEYPLYRSFRLNVVGIPFFESPWSFSDIS